MKLLSLFLIFISHSVLLVSCISKPIVTEAITAKEQINDTLIIFPLLGSGDQKSLTSYNFKDHSLRKLVGLSSTMDLEDVSADKDMFILKDKLESRLTVFSVEQEKIVFQKEFDIRGKRIGIVRISPDKKIIAVSWRPRGQDVFDDLFLINLSDGTMQSTSVSTEHEISDLFWSGNGSDVFSATYDGKKRETIWTKTNAKTLLRQKNTAEPKSYFHPYYSRESYKCKFDLDVTLFEGPDATKDVRSIDKIEDGKRSTIIEFKSGLESHPHGRNFTLWTTPSCKTALLRVRKTLFAVDLENRKMAEIATEFAGTADIIPAKITK